MIHTQQIEMDGRVHTIVTDFFIVAFSITNNTDVPVRITNPRGDYWECKAGQMLSQNATSMGFAVQVVSTGTPTTGNASLTLSSTPVAVPTTTPGVMNANIINSTVAVTGNINATITNTVATTIGNVVNSNISSITAGTVFQVAGGVNANITNAIINTNDIIVQSNTDTLTGLLTLNRDTFALASGSIRNTALTRASAGFGLQSSAAASGRLTVYYTSGATDIYVVRDQILYVSPLSANPTNKRFLEPLQSGDVIHVRWDDSTVVLNAVLRY